MNLDEEIEDSLRVCEELFSYMRENGAKMPVLPQNEPSVNNFGKLNFEPVAKPEPVQEKPEPIITTPVEPVIEKPEPIITTPVEPVIEKPEPVITPVPSVISIPAAEPMHMRDTEPISITQTAEIEKPVLQFAAVDEPISQGTGQMSGDDREQITETSQNKVLEEKKGLVLEAATENKKFRKQRGAGSEYNEAHPTLHLLLNCLICIVAALVLSLVITKFVAHHTSVEGSSMETTLHSGDQLIVEKLSYYFIQPKRFDVIVFPYTEDISYIKRIIGLPGETVQIVNGAIYIDGKILDEHYGREVIEDPGLAADEILLGDDEFFVLGDNRNASEDSRKAEVGTIKKSQIQGRAWLRFFPFDYFGTIK